MADYSEPNTKHPFLVFGVVSLALLMSSIDATIVAVGLPTMMTELHTNLIWIGWTLTGYSLAMTVVMPIAGKLSDEWGRKRLFLGATLLFTLSSMAVGVSSNVYLVIVFRVIQALGGGIFLPSATGIVSDAFGRRRMAAIGLFTSIFPLGGVLGPNIGGVIIDNLSWRWIFYVNVPIGILLLVLGWFILPMTKSLAAERRKIDFLGAGLFAASMLSILYAMTAWGNEPSAFGDLIVWSFLALGGLLIFGFVKHESRASAPMMEMKLFTWRPFAAANVFNLLYGASVFGFFSFIPYYATVAYGMSASEAGFILTPRSLAMAVTSAVSSFFLIRFGYRRPIIAGTIFISLSLMLTSVGFHNSTLLGVHLSDIGVMSLLVTVAGLGMGISGPAANNAALDLLPGKVAAVAGIRGMFRSIGGVLGAAVIVLVVSRFDDKALGMQTVFFALAILVLAVIPVIFLIPDLAKERHALEKSESDEATAVASEEP